MMKMGLNSYNILIKISEYSSDQDFPKALALQYSKERWKAYLLCSRWVQEFPLRYGRYTQYMSLYCKCNLNIA